MKSLNGLFYIKQENELKLLTSAFEVYLALSKLLSHYAKYISYVLTKFMHVKKTLNHRLCF